MKYRILLFLFLTCLFNIYAQSTKKETDTVNKGLSEYEFLKLKKAYAKMQASETYAQVYKYHQILNEKENGLVTPDPLKDNKWMFDEGYTKEWLAANLNKTKFKSVDEAYDLMWKSFDLYSKQENENAEVYELLRKANNEQMMEVLDMETEYILNNQTHK